MERDNRAAAVGYIVLTTEALKKAAKLGREGGTDSALRVHLRDAVDYLERASQCVGFQAAFDFGDDESENAVATQDAGDEPVCRFCGCTEAAPCVDGCAWLGTYDRMIDACTDCARLVPCVVCGESAAAVQRLDSDEPAVCDDCRRSLPAPADAEPEAELATAGGDA
jgi:hypothetical protein